MFIVLILGGLAAFFGVSGSADRFQEAMEAWQRAVRKSVDDDIRREEALRIVASAAQALEIQESELVRTYRSFQETDRRFDTAEAAYELQVVRTEAVWREVDEMLLEKREALRGLLTDAEWQAVLLRVGKASAKVEQKIHKQMAKGDREK